MPIYMPKAGGAGAGLTVYPGCNLETDVITMLIPCGDNKNKHFKESVDLVMIQYQGEEAK